MARKILFVVNVDWFFLSHRLPIALAAIKQGYEVHIATEVTDRLEAMHSAGVIVHPLRVKREEKAWWQNLWMIADLLMIFREVKPDLVHLVTIRPVIFGGIVARWTKVPATVAAISGLGTVFSSHTTILDRLLGGAVHLLYRLALGGKNTKVIFQNEQDKKCLVNIAGLKPDQIELIPGSGVDLKQFHPVKIPDGIPIVLMASRLILDKGVREFIEAARSLKQRGVACRFWLAGDIDHGNPKCLPESELRQMKSEGLVEVLGQQDRMSELMAQASMVVLPSYYKEGIPKVLIEAAASARAIVTTDLPGCRDVVVPNISGSLVPPRDTIALANAISTLAGDKTKCEQMGLEGRKFAEQKFDVNMVVAQHLKIYKELLAREANS